jgi:hypothetical protein
MEEMETIIKIYNLHNYSVFNYNSNNYNKINSSYYNLIYNNKLIYYLKIKIKLVIRIIKK